MKGAALALLCPQTDKILLSHVQPLPFNLAMTHMCCFSPLSQTPKLFFQIGRRPEPGRLLGAQQPHEILALPDHNMAPSGRPENTVGLC